MQRNEKLIAELVQNLTELEKAKIDFINQPICISELVVRYLEEWSHGEQELPQHSDKNNRVLRLYKHIKILAEITKRHHENRYFKDGNIRPDSVNKITRILLNEFALYTKDTPLSENEFSDLLSKIHEIAEHLHINVHLALGTIAVGEEGNVRNISIYVVGGQLPHLTTKSYPIDGDASYIGFTLFGRRLDYVIYELEKHTPYEEGIVAGFVYKQSCISYNPILIIETEGGAKAVIGRDICLDYEMKHTTQAFECHIRSALKNGDFMSYIPQQRLHAILSNTSTVQTKNPSLSFMVAHADPSHEGLCTYTGEEQRSEEFSAENNFKIEVEKTSVQATTKEISVTNPPFGADYTILAYPEYSLASNADLNSENHFKKLIDQANYSMMKHRIEATLKSHDIHTTLPLGPT